MSQPPEHGPGLSGLPKYPGHGGQPMNPYAAGAPLDTYGMTEYGPPQPPPQSHRKNGLAIGGFIVSLFGLSVVAVVMSIVALRQISRRGESGRGFAVAGLVLSGCWTMVLALLLVFGFVGGEQAATGDDTALANLRPGQCYQGDATKRMAVVKVAECTAVHDGEAFAKVPVDLTRVSGDQETLAVGKACAPDFEAFVGLPFAESELEVAYLVLDDISDPDGNVLCIVAGRSGEQLTGTLRGSER